MTSLGYLDRKDRSKNTAAPVYSGRCTMKIISVIVVFVLCLIGGIAGATEMLSDHGLESVSAAGVENNFDAATLSWFDQMLQRLISPTGSSNTGTNGKVDAMLDSTFTKVLTNAPAQGVDTTPFITSVFDKAGSPGVLNTPQNGLDVSGMLNNTFNKTLSSGTQAPSLNVDTFLTGILNKVSTVAPLFTPAKP